MNERPLPSYLTVVLSDLLFPEGPVALPDGTLLFSEIRRGTLSRLSPQGEYSIVSHMGQRPAGVAMGPDGRAYVCNDGAPNPTEAAALLAAGIHPQDVVEPGGGKVQAVDLATGEFETLYTEADGWPIGAANDLVFDEWGGFYFTDFTKNSKRMMTRGRVCYAPPDGSPAYDVVAPLDTANGVALSPDGKTLYVAQAWHARLWAFDVIAPGKVRTTEARDLGGRVLCTQPGFAGFDSMAVDGEGNVCVADPRTGHIVVVKPDGSSWTRIDVGDPYATNLCFGGPDLKTAYITLSGYGQIVSMPWEHGGAPLHFLHRPV